eukprot:snap_masked-scaffold_102-processed-gene-0.18-mRNA-1 protein AED:1.00 eAED:1.00 QI:0/-1/0/0/-1/1/1/0/238
MVENPQLPDGNEIELRALQNLVGELSYVSNNGRPDIAFPVNFIARHVQYKKLGLFRMGRKILRYLINTKNMAIMIKRSESLTLTAFSDAAFADCLEDKFKSSSGFVILLGSVPIVWKAKKLKEVATSTAVAEFLALQNLVKELMFVHYLIFGGFNLEMVRPVVYCDAKAARDIALEEAPSKSTRYLGSKFFLVQQLVENQMIEIKEVGTGDNVADLFTKSLGKKKDEMFSKALMKTML